MGPFTSKNQEDVVKEVEYKILRLDPLKNENNEDLKIALEKTILRLFLV